MRFVIEPNLPKSSEYIIIGEKYAGLLSEKLSEYGIKILPVPNNPHVDQRLSGHADLSVLHMGGENIILAPYLRNSVFEKQLTDLGFHVHFADIRQSADYPNDSQLNVCIVGNNIICSQKFAASRIANSLTNYRKQNLIISRQGYARCSTCVLNGKSIITADKGIAKAASASKMDVLLIQNGHIALNGFDYGFIGGASFHISENLLAFTGRLDAHPDKEKVLNTISGYGIKPVFLTDDPIFDIGSAIPITEK